VYARDMARLVSWMLPQTSARSSAAMRKILPNASALRRIAHETVEKHLEDCAREAGKEQRGNQPSTGRERRDRAYPSQAGDPARLLR
jgi:hypothetical protein